MINATAEFLIRRFSEYTQFRNDCGHDEEVTQFNAKQCALIAISTIIKDIYKWEYQYGIKQLKFWMEVREAIEEDLKESV